MLFKIQTPEYFQIVYAAWEPDVVEFLEKEKESYPEANVVNLTENEILNIQDKKVKIIIGEVDGDIDLEVWLFNEGHRQRLIDCYDFMTKNIGWTMMDALDKIDSNLYMEWVEDDDGEIEIEPKSINISQENTRSGVTLTIDIVGCDGRQIKHTFSSESSVGVNVEDLKYEGLEFKMNPPDSKESTLGNLPYAYTLGNNPYTEDSEYYCHSCGLHLHGEEVGYVAYGRNCANGEHSPCPACGEENSVDRNEPEDEWEMS